MNLTAHLTLAVILGIFLTGIALILAAVATRGLMQLLRRRRGFDAHATAAMALLDCDPVGPACEWADLTASEEDVFAEIAGKCPELGGAI